MSAYYELIAEGITIGKAEGITIGKAEGITIGKVEAEAKKAKEVVMAMLQLGKLNTAEIAAVAGVSEAYVIQLSKK